MDGLGPEERKRWLSHGLASLAVSALGLAVAGSMTLSTSAQTVPAARTAQAAGEGVPPVPVPTTPSAGDDEPAVLQGPLAAFQRNTTAAETAGATLRTAQIHERAAARAEDLVRDAEAITRAARAETSNARSERLQARQDAARENAIRMIQEAQRRAQEALRAAEEARRAAEAAAAAPATSGPSTDGPPPVAGGPVPSGGGAASPVPGAVIGAYFGQYGLWSRYHTGLDFRAAFGVPIRSVKSGVVLFAGNKGDWAGNHVAIRHGDGMTTMSSHMSSMTVGPGQTVQAGQVIGYVGQTGRAFGAHLHFELYPAGVSFGDVYRAVNPQPWLSANGVQTR
jgi:murein DD-endopeptidase MepM/ murein hydrolase activator NlpD